MARFTITKTFNFEAAHSLPHLPASHKCSRLHGHSYEVTVELSGNGITEKGWLVDYAELNVLRDYLNAHFDHKNLNDVLSLPTTAENLASHLFWTCTQWWWGNYVVSVTVKETDNTSATYHRD